MRTLDHRDRQIKNEAEIFPLEVYESPWVLFHGTTNVSAEQIDLQGFKGCSDLAL
jgi:hypothetical protein